MKTNDLVVGQWYKIVRAESNGTHTHFKGVLTEINVTKGWHSFRIDQTQFETQPSQLGKAYQPAIAHHKLSEYTVNFSSRAIKTPCESPLPEPGTPEWAATEFFFWEKNAKKQYQDWRTQQANLAVHKLGLLGIHGKVNKFSGTITLNPDHIERLNRLLDLVRDNAPNLYQEAFDIPDKPVLSYIPPEATQDKEHE